MERGTCKKRIGCIAEVRRSAGELCVEWRIPSFFSLSDVGCNYYESPRFISCDSCWNLRVWPQCWRWSDESSLSLSTIFSKIITERDWVHLCLIRDDWGPPKTIDITVGIKVEYGGADKRRYSFREFRNDDRWILHDFCTRSDLRSREHILMLRDALTIICHMKIPGSATDSTQILHRSTQTAEETKEVEVLIDKKPGIEKALEDFGRLLASGEKSDVTIQVGDAEFKVHSVILFARSPALSASLQHECKEKASNRIIIKDSESEVFRDFLQYLYTGSFQSVTAQNVYRLYCVADKYLADDLKLQCIKHVQNTLCVQTFCDAVKLALLHSESELLQKTIDFAKKNIQSIIISTEWQNFMPEYPKEANEILIKSIGPQN